PVAMTRQPAGAGKAASAMGVVPFISQMPGVPPVLCHMMSDLPSPLKSPIPTTCQDVGVPKLAEPEGIVPAEFVQIVAVPVFVFCQTTSENPLPAKFPGNPMLPGTVAGVFWL